MYFLKLAAATLLALLLWIALVGYAALNGWFINGLAKPGDARAFMDAAVARLQERNRGNAALVLIEDGAIFDEHYVGIEQHIDRDTLFPTASASKWITALTVLRLVEDGKVDLDAPVNGYLTRWQLPTGDYDAREVTVRHLLSHTAGLTDGLGFGDYLPEETVPSLVASLSAPRASSNRDVRIAVGARPGTEFQYSGGGYLALELLVEEVSGERFDEHVRRVLLDPLAMARSTHAWPGDLENVSRSYGAQGEEALLYRYASKAATGFATTAADLARLVLALQGRTGESAPLRPETLAAMRSPEAYMLGMPIWGLGAILYAPTATGAYVYGHDGANEPALNAAIRINPDTRDAFVMLSSGGGMLASTLGFEWTYWQTGLPDFLGMQAVLEGAIGYAAFGSAAILIAACAFAWRLRRRAAPGNP